MESREGFANRWRVNVAARVVAWWERSTERPGATSEATSMRERPSTPH